MEHDSYKVWRDYYTPPGTREYTVDKIETVDEMLAYSLNTLNKALGLPENPDSDQ